MRSKIETIDKGQLQNCPLSSMRKMAGILGMSVIVRIANLIYNIRLTSSRKVLKCIALCILILACSYNMLLAQERFKGAIIAGFNVAQIDGDRLFGYNKFGFNVGGRVATVLSEKWQWSMELAYNQRGSSRTRNDDVSAIYERIQLNYVEAPIMIHFSDWKMQFNAGVSYNRLINFTVLNELGEDITDLQNYRLNNAAIVLGATYFRDEHWGFDFRWSQSLLDLQAGINQGVPWREKWISFRLIYVF
ncbi:MAG: porin family protein [Bacteroidota bacterium]